MLGDREALQTGGVSGDQCCLHSCENRLTGIGEKHALVMMILWVPVGRSLYLGILYDGVVAYWLSSVVHIVRGVSRR